MLGKKSSVGESGRIIAMLKVVVSYLINWHGHDDAFEDAMDREGGSIQSKMIVFADQFPEHIVDMIREDPKVIEEFPNGLVLAKIMGDLRRILTNLLMVIHGGLVKAWNQAQNQKTFGGPNWDQNLDDAMVRHIERDRMRSRKRNGSEPMFECKNGQCIHTRFWHGCDRKLAWMIHADIGERKYWIEFAHKRGEISKADREPGSFQLKVAHLAPGEVGGRSWGGRTFEFINDLMQVNTKFYVSLMQGLHSRALWRECFSQTSHGQRSYKPTQIGDVNADDLCHKFTEADDLFNFLGVEDRDRLPQHLDSLMVELQKVLGLWIEEQTTEKAKWSTGDVRMITKAVSVLGLAMKQWSDAWSLVWGRTEDQTFSGDGPCSKN